MGRRKRPSKRTSVTGRDTIPMTPYEEEQIDQVQAWKAEEPGVADRTLGFVVKPLAWLVQKVVPPAAMKAALEAANAAGARLADVGDIKRDGGVDEIAELRTKDLELSDRIADSVHNWAIGAAVVLGTGAGAGGIMTAPIEIPALLTLATRTIHKIGLCYGYEPRTESDKKFALAILASAGASSLEEKYTALLTLRTVEVAIAKQTWKALAQRAAERQFGKEAAITSLRTLAKQLGVNLTKRKALTTIPVVGAAVGGSVNGWYLKDVGWAARRAFQERWLLDNHKIIEIDVPGFDEDEP